MIPSSVQNSGRCFLTIRTKFAAIVAVLIAGISFFIFLYFPAKLEKQAIEAMAAKAKSISEMTAFSISPALLFSDQESIEEVFQSAKQNKDLAYLVVLDSNGRVITAHNQNAMALEGFAHTKDDNHIDPDEMVYGLQTPILHQGRQIGQLYLGLSLDEIKADLVKIKKIISLISLIIFVVGMVSVYLIGTVVTHPLRRMVNTVEKITHGDLTQRAGVSSQDEVGQLARSFNTMVEKLAATQRELENLNRNLEKRVRARTEELQNEICERKRAEQEIEKRERMYREAIEVADAVPYYLNYISETYEFVGTGIRAMTGYAEEEFNHETFDLMILDTILLGSLQGLPLHEAVAKARSEKGVSWRADYHIKTRQGQEKWLNNAAIQVKDEQGSVIGSLGMLQDITERKRNEEELKYRVELEKLITNISTNFINLDPCEISTAINRALRTIGEFIDVDSGYVFLFSEKGETLSKAHAWCSKNRVAQIDNSERLPFIRFPSWMEKLKKFEVIYIPAVDQFPAKAIEERAFLHSQEIKSLIVVPLAYGGSLMGFLEFDSMRTERAWPEHIIAMLKIVGGVFANALARKKADEQINASLKEKEVMLKEIHHRVKNNLQVICSLLNLQSEHIVDVQARQMFKESQDRVRSMALIHEKLYQSKDLAMVDFAGYIHSLTTELFRSYWPLANDIRMQANIENVILGIDKAIPCGLIVNELVTNSLKHAFPDGRKGEVVVNVCPYVDHQMLLSVRDNGIGMPNDLDIRNTHSLGLQLICTLSDQIDGSIEVDRTQGTEVKIIFASDPHETTGTGEQSTNSHRRR